MIYPLSFDRLIDQLTKEDMEAIQKGRPARERVFIIAERVARWAAEEAKRKETAVG